MITKQEYMDLKKRRAEIAETLKYIKLYKSVINWLYNESKSGAIKESYYLFYKNRESGMLNLEQSERRELKWLDILLRDTKEQLRNRYESKRLEELFLKKLTKHIIPEEFKLEYEVSKTPKTED